VFFVDGTRCHHPIRASHRITRVTAAVAVTLGSVLSGLTGPAGVAAADGAFPPSEKIFPATTRGWVSISHGPEFRQRFNRTQYGLLLKDPSMKPFIESVRKQLESSNSGRLGRLGLTLDDLDELPRPANILNAHPRETEAIMARLDVNRIAAPKSRHHIDWNALGTLRNESPEAEKLIQWLSRCLEERRAEPFKEEG
jgi:hypothetical protein